MEREFDLCFILTSDAVIYGGILVCKVTVIICLSFTGLRNGWNGNNRNRECSFLATSESESKFESCMLN